MNHAAIRNAVQRPSKETIRRNPEIWGTDLSKTSTASGVESPAVAAPGNRAGGGDRLPAKRSGEKPASPTPREMRGILKDKLILRLVGQVRGGGKNAMGINHKTGRHFARPAFKKWRAEMTDQICVQLREWKCITESTNLRVDYVAEDRKRRDQPGIFDALFHLLEWCGVVADDHLLWVTESSRSYDKSAPGVVITFL